MFEGGKGSGKGQFDCPSAIAIDGKGWQLDAKTPGPTRAAFRARFGQRKNLHSEHGGEPSQHN